MRQQTLAAQTGFEKYGRKSKREQFLEVEQIVSWAELQALIEPHCPKGENGRPPVGLSIMLRVYFLQQWFNLLLSLSQLFFVDLRRAPAPDERAAGSKALSHVNQIAMEQAKNRPQG